MLIVYNLKPCIDFYYFVFTVQNRTEIFTNISNDDDDDANNNDNSDIQNNNTKISKYTQ